MEEAQVSHTEHIEEPKNPLITLPLLQLDPLIPWTQFPEPHPETPPDRPRFQETIAKERSIISAKLDH